MTLTNVFESNKEALVEKLKGLSLPCDAQKVQAVVADFLNSLFESDGEYRQNLVQSEDYILQAAVQLLQTQQNIAAEIVAANAKVPNLAHQPAVASKTNSNLEYTPILGTGVGALVGTFFGTWGAVCGAIAGTAVAIYYGTKSANGNTPSRKEPQTAHLATTINVTVFSDIVRKICESIDNLMQTYRVQVKRVENLYSQTEKPSLLNECPALLAQVANVYKTVQVNKECTPPKVVSVIEMLVESLENYGLTIKDGKVVSA